MTGPEFVAEDGAAFRLKWTRLKPTFETGATVPSPPVRGALAPYNGFSGPGSLVRDLVVSDRGFDSGQVQVRRWSGEDRSRLFAGGVEIGGEDRPDYLEAVRPDRVWSADEFAQLESEAADILRQHDFPLLLSFPRAALWTWIGEDLCWAEHPGPPGRLTGGEELLFPAIASLATWGAVQCDVRFDKCWPRWSTFEWAETVQGYLARRRRIQDASAAGGLGGSEFQYLWDAGYALGAYLSEHRVRTLYSPLLERGEASRRAVMMGAAETKKLKDKTIAEERDHALELAAEAAAKPAPEGYNAWSLSLLADDICGGWKRSGRKPGSRKIREFLKTAQKAGMLCLAGIS